MKLPNSDRMPSVEDQASIALFPYTDSEPETVHEAMHETIPYKLVDCLYFDKSDFNEHIAKAEPFPIGTLYAGIVPHHLLAGDLIASYFLTAANGGTSESDHTSDHTIETVIVLGPNHGGIGNSISIADGGWNTPFGVVECDTAIVNAILSDRTLSANVDNNLLQTDHSVSGLVPYLNYYLPEAKVVTLLLSGKMTREQENTLAELLNHVSQEQEILVVGSIDFSHGLLTQEALRRDENTLELILSRSYDVLKQLPGEYLDSPETLNVLLRYMELWNPRPPQLLCHRSAADYLLNAELLPECTTYFVLGAEQNSY